MFYALVQNTHHDHFAGQHAHPYAFTGSIRVIDRVRRLCASLVRKH
ncbi:MAG: hypothetical protein JO218_19255 [Burkholderiales bacterium]|nr:hypothetical protein [Burkholderiales bacterium]